MLCPLANRLWLTANLARARTFRAALSRPAETQHRVLAAILARNARCEFGKRHGFHDIDNPDAFRLRVPLTRYDGLASAIDRIRAGEPNVLTSDPVTRLMPSSGSTAARKLIPWTRPLQAEFNNAIGPWISALFSDRPSLMDGPAYWSVSPSIPDDETRTKPDKQPPIGFDDDTDYLGGWARHLVTATLAVPSSVRRIYDIDVFRYITALHLLRASNLRLISVWHPSFLTLQLTDMTRRWDRLLDDIRRGGAGLAPDPRRADALARAGPRPASAIWPRLGVVSCWTHAFAAHSLPALRDALGGVEIQPKGLLATEAFVTIPLGDLHPLALRSHFFEFLDDAGRSRLAHELELDAEYEVVVTTGGGLYRYRMGDRVRVDGFAGKTPSLVFLGRQDRVSDRRGEKLSEAFVAETISTALRESAITARFAMLAPDTRDGEVCYTLFLEAPPGDSGPLLDRLEILLRANPHYDYCRRLGQLGPPRLFRVARHAEQAFASRMAARQRLGDIKPTALSTDDGWEAWFEGDNAPTAANHAAATR